MAKKRVIRLALLPILAPLFIVGWMLAHVGEQKSARRVPSRPRVVATQKEDTFEIGILSEGKEELVISEACSQKKTFA